MVEVEYQRFSCFEFIAIVIEGRRKAYPDRQDLHLRVDIKGKACGASQLPQESYRHENRESHPLWFLIFVYW